MGFLRRMVIGLALAALSFGLLAVAVSLVFGAVRTAMTQEAPMRPNREVVRSVNVVTWATGSERPVLETYGEVQARRALEIRATAPGKVVSLAPHFVDGGQVAAGDLLAQIDPATAEADVAVARADLAEAEADLRDAERSLVLAQEDLAAAEEQETLRRAALTRQQDLASRKVGTAAAVEEAALSASSARQAVVSRRQALAAAEVRIDLAETTLERSRIALAEAERALADTTITAAFAGTLSDVAVDEGGLVSTNEKLADLVDPTALEVAFRISTAQYARLLDGDGDLIGLPVTATLAVAGLDVTASGVIDRASATVGEGLTGRLVFARIDAVPGFRPGDFVTVRIEEPVLERVARLPAQALGADGAVLVLADEDRLDVVPVTLERRQDDAVLVTGPGWLEGREVVAERSPVLGAGVRVKPQRADGEAPEGPEMLTLDAERRARLVAFVEANTRMSDEVRTRLLGELAADQVPAQTVERLESRMGS